MQDRFELCVDRNELLGFLREALDERREGEVAAHLDNCAGCRDELESLAGGDSSWTAAREAFALRDDDLARDLRWIESLLEPCDDPQRLGRLGEYEICSHLGRGSTGVVVKAWEPRLSRFVAIKLLDPSFARFGPARKRFEREARAVAAVTHEHVVPIHAVDEFDGVPFLVMQYVAGRSLQQRLAQDGPMDNCQVARLGRQVASGLAAAHAQGVVHRDVKPANVMLENGVERAVVTDFGLARVNDEASMTSSGAISGTPEFMSPEQAKGRSVDARSDLFSLGSVLYAACTGHPPFRSETVFGVIKRVCDDQARPIREHNPAIAPWLEALIAKLMAKDKEDRFESAEEVARILAGELAHLQDPTNVPRPLREWMQASPISSRGDARESGARSQRARSHAEPRVGADSGRPGSYWNAFSQPVRRRPLVAAACVALLAGAAWTLGDDLLGLGNADGGRGTERIEKRGLNDSGEGAVAALHAKWAAPAAVGGEQDRASGASQDRSELSKVVEVRKRERVGDPGRYVSIEREFTGGVIDGYGLYVPRGHGRDQTRYPVLFCLAGGCQVGGKVTSLRCWGLPEMIVETLADKSKLTRKDKKLRKHILDTFIVIAPHMKDGPYEERQFWQHDKAMREILDEVKDSCLVDEDRVYMSGAGRGGHGAWGLASRMPGVFAAVVAIRGYRDGIKDYDELSRLPIWVAHCREDSQVDYRESVLAVREIERLSGAIFERRHGSPSGCKTERKKTLAKLANCRRIFLTAPGDGWSDLYRHNELYDWLLRQRRPARIARSR